MYLQLPHIFLLIVAGSIATSTSRDKTIQTINPTVTDLPAASSGISLGFFGPGPVIPDSSVFTDQDRHGDVDSSITGFVTIQTSPSTPTASTSTSSGLYTIQNSPPIPTTASLKPRAVEDWYTDNHRTLNKFGRFIFRVTRLGKRLFLYLTSSVEFIHDENDEMIDISDLTPAELADLISGVNITAIVDARTNSTIFLNGTITDTNTTSTFLRRRKIANKEGKDTSSLVPTNPEPLRPLTIKEQLSHAFRNLGYSIKSLFVSELFDERTQRERLARGQITQWEFDHWLETASKEPAKTIFSKELDRDVVNEAYTKWAMARMRYASRPVEFAGGRKGTVNPDYVAWDIQQADHWQRPARYFFNGTRSACYNSWQAKELKFVGPKLPWLKDGTMNPLYVAVLVKEVDYELLDVQPREWLQISGGTGIGLSGRRLNPEYVAREIRDAKRQGRPARWDLEGGPNEQFYAWEEGMAEKAKVEKRGLVVPDFDDSNENAANNWEAWKAAFRSGNSKRGLVVPDFDDSSEKAAHDWEEWKASFRSGNTKRGLVVPDYDSNNENGQDDWETWKAAFRSGITKRGQAIPDYDPSNENAADDWETWKASFRAGNSHQKRDLFVPDFEAVNKDGVDVWEAWKAKFRAGHGKRDVDAEGKEFDEEAWNKFVEEQAKEMFFPELNVPEAGSQ